MGEWGNGGMGEYEEFFMDLKEFITGWCADLPSIGFYSSARKCRVITRSNSLTPSSSGKAGLKIGRAKLE